MQKININFEKEIGKIKPMNGVGQPPFYGMDFSMFDYLKDANIPYSRLHDVGGPYGRNVFVDVPNIFRDFNADQNDPKSYSFEFTDLLITALIEHNVEPVFRLGVTIENFATVRAFNIYPPADYQKWAEICEHIIKHYTEGWNDGYNYKMTYWEIWNEPDILEDPMENTMWRGTAEQFYDLYDIAAKHLKKKFPHLKIGGYGASGFYALPNSSNPEDPNPRWPYITNFFKNFIKFIKEKNSPLDFFSFHAYTDAVLDNVVSTNFVREYLDKNGYNDTEMLLTEWDCQVFLKGTVRHAAFTAGVMLALQDTALEGAMFYDARYGVGLYAAVFDSTTAKPLPAYYSFLAFGELLKRRTQVDVGDLPAGIYVVAAKAEDGCVVITNTNEEDINVELAVCGFNEITECKIIAEDSVWQDYEFSNVLPKNSVFMIKYK